MATYFLDRQCRWIEEKRDNGSKKEKERERESEKKTDIWIDNHNGDQERRF